MKMKFHFRFIYLTQLEIYKGEKKLNKANKLLKLLQNTSGIHNNILINNIYCEISKYYKDCN